MNSHSVFHILIVITILIPAFPVNGNTIPLFISSDGSLVLATNTSRDVLRLIDTTTKQTITVEETRGIGTTACISPDNRYICYTRFISSSNGRLQIPVVFDIQTRSSRNLYFPSVKAASPVMADDGTMALSIENRLLIVGSDWGIREMRHSGCCTNLLAFSPDSKKIAFCEEGEQIRIQSLDDGGEFSIIPCESCIRELSFSPGGDRILMQSNDGRIYCCTLDDKNPRFLSEGQSASWLDNGIIAFTRWIGEDGRSGATELIVMDISGREIRKEILESGCVHTAINGCNAAFVSSNLMHTGSIDQDKTLSYQTFEILP